MEASGPDFMLHLPHLLLFRFLTPVRPLDIGWLKSIDKLRVGRLPCRGRIHVSFSDRTALPARKLLSTSLHVQRAVPMAMHFLVHCACENNPSLGLSGSSRIRKVAAYFQTLDLDVSGQQRHSVMLSWESHPQTLEP